MDTEFGRMAYHWPADTDFALWELDVLDRNCPACGRLMHICDHRYRRLHTLDGPVQLICKLNHCPDPTCPGHARTKSPELEITIALPQVAIGWDVFCWIGHRRCSRHMAIPLIGRKPKMCQAAWDSSCSFSCTCGVGGCTLTPAFNSARMSGPVHLKSIRRSREKLCRAFSSSSSQRPDSAAARSTTIPSAFSSSHNPPGPLILKLITRRMALSTAPEPMGKPRRRNRA